VSGTGVPRDAGVSFPRNNTKDTKNECIGVTTIAVGTCLRQLLLCVGLKPRGDKRMQMIFCPRPEGRGNTLCTLTYVPWVSWTTPRHQHAPQQKPAPAESAAVRAGMLQSKALGFGADCKPVFRLHILLTHRNLRHAGRRLKRAFRFRNVLWLLSSKESNNKKNLCSNSALSLRHGVGRDAPVLGW
jgi:hypothetical protein